MKDLAAGIYLLTHHDGHSDDRLYRDVAAALRGGIALLQYRDKSGDSARRERQARQLLTLCRDHRVPLIINDDLDLCERIGADGLHLGRDDGGLARARERLGPEAILGASCYNEWARAEAAASAGADYLAFGSVFPSRTKPDAVTAPLDLLARASAHFDRPVCAIGGIDADNIGQVAASGARLAAVIGSVWESEDPAARVRTLRQRFERAH